MYYRSFFCKENAFNAVFFLAIFIFAIVKFVLFPDELASISFILSILITLLSIIDLFVKSLERIINDQDEKIYEEFDYLIKKYDDGLNNSLYDISSMDKQNFIDYLENIKSRLVNVYDEEYDLNSLKMYWEIIQVRRTFRKVRKVLLGFYYITLLSIIVLIMFSSNLTFFIGLKQIDMTIWSFVIILFDVLLSQPINASIYNALSKYYYKKAETLKTKNNKS